MTDPQVDPERLAALLDGRLGEAERTALLARLAASEELLAIYADAAAVARELEEEERSAPPAAAPAAATDLPRPAPARAWRGPASRPRLLAWAAVIAVVALAPWLWMRSRPSLWNDPGRGVAYLASAELPAGWEARPWSTTRGGGEPLAPEARAARVGALLADLELAARSDPGAVPGLTAEVALLLEGVPGAAPVAARYREAGRLAGETPSAVEPLLESGWEDVGRFLDADRMRLSALAETARIAAARRDAGFFRAGPVRAAWARAAELPSLPPALRAAVREARAAAEDPEGDWTALRGALDSLLRLLGS